MLEWRARLVESQSIGAVDCTRTSRRHNAEYCSQEPRMWKAWNLSYFANRPQLISSCPVRRDKSPFFKSCHVSAFLLFCLFFSFHCSHLWIADRVKKKYHKFPFIVRLTISYPKKFFQRDTTLDFPVAVCLAETISWSVVSIWNSLPQIHGRV